MNKLPGLAGKMLAMRAESSGAATKLADTVSRSVADDIFSCALKRQTGVTLRHMMDFGSNPVERQLKISAQFLRAELPIRLAHRVAELENLPYGLSAKNHILKVRDWYVDSFRELRSFPEIKDSESELQFTALLKNIYQRHQHVVPVMAMGVAELKEDLSHEIGLNDLPEIHQFLDGFYLSRIGIRILIGQHIALHDKQRKDHIGLICTRCYPLEVVNDAIADARAICLRECGDAPEVTVHGSPDAKFAYVPSHIHHMVFELVKNSLRAVNDRFADSDDPPPPVQVVVAEGSEDVTIKVSDEGGGIARSDLPRIFTYLYSTASSPLPDMDLSGEFEGPAVLAGYGYGLPVSRLYARYFGGDLQLISMEGHGVDSYLHLNRLGNVQEPLP